MKLKILVVLSLVLFISTTADAQKSKKPTVRKQIAKAKIDSPDASMKQFIRAVQRKDQKAFLTFFSLTKPLRIKNYQATGDKISFIKYTELVTIP